MRRFITRFEKFADHVELVLHDTVWRHEFTFSLKLDRAGDVPTASENEMVEDYNVRVLRIVRYLTLLLRSAPAVFELERLLPSCEHLKEKPS
jgi:hypothetical protein